MRRRDDRYECTICGAALDVAEGKERSVWTMVVAVAGKPNVRTMMLDGKELHRCQIGPNED